MLENCAGCSSRPAGGNGAAGKGWFQRSPGASLGLICRSLGGLGGQCCQAYTRWPRRTWSGEPVTPSPRPTRCRKGPGRGPPHPSVGDMQPRQLPLHKSTEEPPTLRFHGNPLEITLQRLLFFSAEEELRVNVMEGGGHSLTPGCHGNFKTQPHMTPSHQQR